MATSARVFAVPPFVVVLVAAPVAVILGFGLKVILTVPLALHAVMFVKVVLVTDLVAPPV
jgi:hypothetical protein